MRKNLASQVVWDGQIAVGVALMKRVTLKCGEKLRSLKRMKILHINSYKTVTKTG